MRNYILIILAILLVITGCCCKDSAKSDETDKVKVAEHALPPGTAIVEVEIITVDENTCTFKIEKIKKRGQGTNTLISGQEHIVRLVKNKQPMEFQKGKKYILTIEGQQVPAMMGEKDGIKWQIINVNK